ncbi:MAG TPA: hypothetical protein VJT49_09055 [Amycolatopsis sp.]|uniref:hypothetical protein n=1 Tax=Amycolatopsis sp. TaxID=37632 RepID=UPI002B46C382|nr:hypothetical protein [Amycolatopsis sp.]HKS45249.1 hypothetical protein [Amycolatopsis sp.]
MFSDRAPTATIDSSVPLDELQSVLRLLATTSSARQVKAGLTVVIETLDAQSFLVTTPFEDTFGWLTLKLRTLRTAVEERADHGVLRQVNALAARLADALE